MPLVAVCSPHSPRPEFLELAPQEIETVCGGGLDVVDLKGGLVAYFHRTTAPRSGFLIEGRWFRGNVVVCRISDESIVLSLTAEDEERVLRGMRRAS